MKDFYKVYIWSIYRLVTSRYDDIYDDDTLHRDTSYHDLDHTTSASGTPNPRAPREYVPSSTKFDGTTSSGSQFKAYTTTRLLESLALHRRPPCPTWCPMHRSMAVPATVNNSKGGHCPKKKPKQHLASGSLPPTNFLALRRTPINFVRTICPISTTTRFEWWLTIRRLRIEGGWSRRRRRWNGNGAVGL